MSVELMWLNAWLSYTSHAVQKNEAVAFLNHLIWRVKAACHIQIISLFLYQNCTIVTLVESTNAVGYRAPLCMNDAVL